MPIAGLLGTEQFASERFTSIRRSVFYQYPNGSSPLMGLLSMLDGEVLNDPEFSWYEKRLKEKSTPVTNSTGFFKVETSNAPGASVGANPLVAGTAYWVNVTDTSIFRENDIVQFQEVATAGTTLTQVQGRITKNATTGLYVSTTNIRVVLITDTATVDLSTTVGEWANCRALVLSNSSHQGSGTAQEGLYNLPTSTGNAAQIFKTPFSFTGTALRTAAKFDETGPYKDKAKEHSVQHMIELEQAFLFGVYDKVTDSEGQPAFTTGGIEFFLRLWEVGNGNAYAGVTSTYGNEAATANTDSNKRIINVDGNITESALDDYYERLFHFTNNIANEKIAFVGAGFLNVINKLYKGSTTLNSDIPSTEAYGMSVVKHMTPFGDVYYKTHPLFTRNAARKYDALFIDPQYMKYRYVQDRDTEIRENIQNNGDDLRRDEWLTEAGLELQFPEANMYFSNVTGAA